MIWAAVWLIAASTNVDARTGPARQQEAVAVLAGGCYWGTETVFEHVRGVESVTSGFARYDEAANPVRVEAVRIVYDPAVVSYRQLLEIFFVVAHDPTSRDRQGPDAGPEYRAVVLAQDATERDSARDYVRELTAAQMFTRPIVTEIGRLTAFDPVPEPQQDYAVKHPTDPYIVINDAPKLVRLQQRFPALYR
jgi:peptide-methionine (S)-S-oxide reductase